MDLINEQILKIFLLGIGVLILILAFKKGGGSGNAENDTTDWSSDEFEI